MAIELSPIELRLAKKSPSQEPRRWARPTANLKITVINADTGEKKTICLNKRNGSGKKS